MTEQPANYPPSQPGGYGYQPSPPGGYGYQPSPPGGYGYPPPGVGYPPPQGAGTNGMAIASLVSSLLGWLCVIGPILGLIFGFIALGQIKKTGQGGRGMALAGIIIGGVLVALSLVYLIIVIVVAATHGTDTSAAMLITVEQQAFSQAVIL